MRPNETETATDRVGEQGYAIARRNALIAKELNAARRKLGLPDGVSGAECRAGPQTAARLLRLSKDPRALGRMQDLSWQREASKLAFARTSGLAWTPVIARMSHLERSRYQR